MIYFLPFLFCFPTEVSVSIIMLAYTLSDIFVVTIRNTWQAK